MLRKGSCLVAKRKQRLKNKLKGLKRQGKRKKQVARTIVKKAKGKGILRAFNSKDNKLESKL